MSKFVRVDTSTGPFLLDVDRIIAIRPAKEENRDQQMVIDYEGASIPVLSRHQWEEIADDLTEALVAKQSKSRTKLSDEQNENDGNGGVIEKEKNGGHTHRGQRESQVNRRWYRPRPKP